MDRRREEERNGQNSSSAWTAVGAVAGIGALIGGAYWLASRKSEDERDSASQQHSQRRRSPSANPNPASSHGVANYLSSLLSYLTPPSFEQRSVPRSAVPVNPDITNLNGLLSDIYVRFIQLKDEDFQLHYTVFMDILLKLHESMKQVDPYYKRYSSNIQFAGSHYDRLRIKKPDEFDMDIVISLPLNYNSHPEDPSQSDFILEPKSAGFVQLKMGTQYRNLPLRDGADWLINRAAYEWRDDRDYLLRSNFINWFKSVVTRGLNANGANRIYYVDGVPYTVRTSESGPAITLFIENFRRGFKLDVDLVPALRFSENRWPICRGYRDIPITARREYWMLVPKPNKGSGVSTYDTSRSWRIALQDQERALMKNLNNCKQIIRMLKKLRDAQDMKKIASYYVKTLFLWKIVKEDDPMFWRKSPAELFKIMVFEFYDAMVTGSIPYFWNKDNNLIAAVDRGILNTYAGKLEKLLQILEQPWHYKLVAKFLLTKEEFDSYNASFLHI